MRTTILMLVVGFIINTSTFGQKISADKLPALIYKMFVEKYPSVTKPSWFMISSNEYEAIFKINKDKFTAVFDKEGKWIATKSAVETSSLPKEVQLSVTKQFPGFEIVEAEKVEVAEKELMYKLNVEKKDKVFDLEISTTGEIVKRMAVVEGD